MASNSDLPDTEEAFVKKINVWREISLTKKYSIKEFYLDIDLKVTSSILKRTCLRVKKYKLVRYVKIIA